MKKMNYKSEIIALVLISIFLFSNIIFFEEMRFQDKFKNSKGLSENQVLKTPKASAVLGVTVSPESASKVYGNTQIFEYTLSSWDFDMNNGEWEINIDNGGWEPQGTWSLALHMNVPDLYWDTLYYTTSTTLSIGSHIVHAKFCHSDCETVEKDATIEITGVPPLPPTDVQPYQHTCYDGTVIITWTKSSEATKYQLYEAITSDGEYTAIGPELGDVDSTSVPKFSEQTCFYKVKAGNSDAWSVLSTSFATVTWSAPESPTITLPVTQTVYTHSSFSVTRASVESYVNEFDWKISIDGEAYSDWSENSSSTLTYDPSAGYHQYQFRLQVRNGNFEVWSDYGYSDIITISTPSYPRIFQVSEETCYDGSVTFSWTLSDGATSYTLYEATTSDGIYIAINSSISDASIQLSKSTEDTLYYKLKAVNDVGDSDFSGFIAVTWSAPDSPGISSPVTQIVDTQESISVIRDSVGSYVDEFDWEISINEETYTNWSESSSNSLTYDPLAGDHTHQFRLRVRNSEFGIWSDYSYSGTHTITIPLEADTISPLIDSPIDLSYFYNTTGHSIAWNVSDSNPYQYQLFIDGVGQGINAWNGNDLSLNVEGLSVGNHNVTLWVSDIEGNWIQDHVDITVEMDPADVINPGSFSGIAIGTISTIFLIGAFIGIYAIKKKSMQ